jgi:adenosylcobinamide kinase / adenosylcobinamide-phosphate guanylyltransferase
MLILATGGSRSGKSSFALRRAAKCEAPRMFLATAQASDGEMARRIAAHQKARPAGWGLVEEPLRVPEALAAALRQASTVVLDCVTIWISNLILSREGFDEAQAAREAQALVQSARVASRTVIVVTNEVGCGVVPDNELARRFRDCAGRANQVIAAASDEVYLLASGIPLKLKPQERNGIDE